jgi:hypothetical protein
VDHVVERLLFDKCLMDMSQLSRTCCSSCGIHPNILETRENIDAELQICKLVLMRPAGHLFCIEFHNKITKPSSNDRSVVSNAVSGLY